MNKAAPPVDAVWRSMSPLKAWLAVTAGTLGGFMALLDTSIANAALPVIQGEIGATSSEGTWIGTAYLTTEIVVVPLTAWLERMIGVRRFLLISAVMFTIFSVICGLSTNLTMMIIGRLGQGISGSMMIPSAYSIVARMLPADQQSKGMAIVTGPMLLAPILGPLLGGWLTEQYSWHYAFFINVPFCLILIALLVLVLPPVPGDLSEIGDGDWLGIAGMVVGLGALTVLLEEGHREQWFESTMIWQLAIAAGFGFILVALGQIWAKRPVVDLSLLASWRQASANLLMMTVGMIMFCTMFVVPQFLSMVRGFSPFQAGHILIFTGVSSIIIMFGYSAIIRRANVALLTMGATLTAGFACSLGIAITAETGSDRFIALEFIVGGGMALMAMPVQQVSIMSVPHNRIAEMTSIITVARNLGGSIGLAVLASFQEGRLEFHRWRLQESVAGNDPAVLESLDAGSRYFGGGADGWETSLRMFDAQLMHNALVMTFSDTFFALAVVAACVSPLALLLPRRMPGAEGPVAMH